MILEHFGCSKNVIHILSIKIECVKLYKSGKQKEKKEQKKRFILRPR